MKAQVQSHFKALGVAQKTLSSGSTNVADSLEGFICLSRTNVFTDKVQERRFVIKIYFSHSKPVTPYVYRLYAIKYIFNNMQYAFFPPPKNGIYFASYCNWKQEHLELSSTFVWQVPLLQHLVLSFNKQMQLCHCQQKKVPLHRYCISNQKAICSLNGQLL